MNVKKEVMTEKHSLFSQFVKDLSGPMGCNFQLNENGLLIDDCPGDDNVSNTIKILKQWPFIDIPKSLKYFAKHGGYCDANIPFVFGTGAVYFSILSDRYVEERVRRELEPLASYRNSVEFVLTYLQERLFGSRMGKKGIEGYLTQLKANDSQIHKRGLQIKEYEEVLAEVNQSISKFESQISIVKKLLEQKDTELTEGMEKTLASILFDLERIAAEKGAPLKSDLYLEWAGMVEQNYFKLRTLLVPGTYISGVSSVLKGNLKQGWFSDLIQNSGSELLGLWSLVGGHVAVDTNPDFSSASVEIEDNRGMTVVEIPLLPGGSGKAAGLGKPTR